jgi:hypothetical protein
VEAAAITGHASLKELKRYIEDRDRKKAARRAMGKLRSGTELSNPTIRFDSEAKKRDRTTEQNASGSPGLDSNQRPTGRAGGVWLTCPNVSTNGFLDVPTGHS